MAGRTQAINPELKELKQELRSLYLKQSLDGFSLYL